MRLLILALFTLTLAACGGGSGGAPSSPPGAGSGSGSIVVINDNYHGTLIASDGNLSSVPISISVDIQHQTGQTDIVSFDLGSCPNGGTITYQGRVYTVTATNSSLSMRTFDTNVSARATASWSLTLISGAG